MKLPAFFGHKRSINLLPRDSFENSTLGVILEWALQFGKWAVIVTQLIVMIAFLWRFGLDRQLTDLRKSIAKDTAIVKSYDQVERDYVLAQKRVQFAKPIIEDNNKISQILTRFSEIIPSDVWLEKLSLSNGTINFTANSKSLNGFGQFLTALQREPMFSSISVAKLQDGGAQNAKLQFEVALVYAKEAGKK